MARIKEEDLRLNIIVNGAEAGKKQLQEYKTNLSAAQEYLDKLQQKQKVLENTNRQSSKEYQRLTKEIQAQQVAVNGHKQKLSELERQQKLNNMTLSELQKHLRLTKIALAQAVPGTQNWKALQKEVSATSSRLKELKSGGQGIGSALGKISGLKLGWIGAATAALAGLTKFAKTAFDKISDFEQANANLSTILGKNVNDIKSLTDSALKLGRETEYTASQVTLLQTELAKLGFGEAAIRNMQKPVLEFATAVGADLPEAAALAGATLRIFGLQSGDTEDTLATLAVATNKSALNFSYLQTSMSIVGPVANAFGFSVKDTTALLGALANAGFDASSAATATRNILLNLADANGKLAKGMGKPVKTFPELIAALKELQAKGVDLNEALEMTDKRSVSAFSNLLSGAGSVEELRSALEDVDGELERISKERLNTVQGSVKMLQSAWEGFILSMSGSKGVIKGTIDFITKAVTGMTKALFPEAAVQSQADEYFNRFKTIYQEQGSDALEAMLKDWEDKSAASVERAESGGTRKDIKRATRDDQAIKLAAQQIREVVANDVVEAALRESNSATTPGGGSSSSSGSKSKNDKNSSGRKSVWSLEKDQAFLAAKAELTRQFNEGEITMEEEYNEKLYQLEVASLTARLALNEDKGAAREKIESDLQGKIKAHKEKMVQQEAALVKFQDSLETDKTQIAINAENRRYEEQIKAYKKLKGAININDSDIEKMKARHARNLLDIELDRINRMRTLASQEHANEVAAIKNAHSDKMLAMKNGSAAEREEIRAQNLEIAKMDVEYFQKYVDEIQKMIAEAEANTTGASEEETSRTLADLKAKLQDAFAKLYAAQEIINGENEGLLSGSGRGDLFGVSPDQWDTLFERLSNGTMQASDLSTILEGIGGAAAEGMNIASMAIDKINAKEQKAFDEYRKQNDKKRDILDDRLKAGLMSQAQYDKEIEGMQKEEDAKEEEMKLQQAKRDKAMAVTQATIDGALSVAKTFAAFPWPASLIPAGIAAGLAAAQVALIASTPISTGYAAGGYVTRAQDGRKFPARLSPDKRGFVSGPTILVGEAGGEYVIPADGLQNPSLAPFIGSIETARKMGTLRSINFGSLYPAAQVAAFATGGYTERSGGVSTVVAGSNEEILERMERIIEKMDNRPPVEVPLLGRRGIRAAEEKYERYKNNGRI